MKVLVTGARGFVGPYLVDELRRHGHDVVPTSLNHPARCDLSDTAAVERLVKEVSPEAVAHLAAISHVPGAWKDPKAVERANVGNTERLCRALSENGKPVVFLLASSAMVYGGGTGSSYFHEKSKPHPSNPYGQTKLLAESAAKKFEGNNVRVYVARAFNHTGPGQTDDFLIPALSARIKRAENGAAIPVGNLNVARDFSDVRDIVRAYRLILEKRPRQRLFVLGSGKATPLKKILGTLVGFSKKRISLEVDAALLRPSDPPLIASDPRLAKKILGWTPRIPLKKTLLDVYNSVSTK